MFAFCFLDDFLHAHVLVEFYQGLLNLRKNTVRMQASRESSRKRGQDADSGKLSRKHGQDASPSKVFEKTRLAWKAQEELRENLVRMQTLGNLRENTAKMQTPEKFLRKHGQDANIRQIFEKTRSGCKPH